MYSYTVNVNLPIQIFYINCKNILVPTYSPILYMEIIKTNKSKLFF